MVDPSRTPTRTILVVDDDPAICELIADVLTDAGYTVTTAAGGQEGLERATAERPDLILMDGTLPDLDGVSMGRALKADAPTRGIPVMALTASIDPTPLMAAGCPAFIPKPFHPQEFVDTVARLIQQTVGRRPREV